MEDYEMSSQNVSDLVLVSLIILLGVFMGFLGLLLSYKIGLM